MESSRVRGLQGGPRCENYRDFRPFHQMKIRGASLTGSENSIRNRVARHPCRSRCPTLHDARMVWVGVVEREAKRSRKLPITPFAVSASFGGERERSSLFRNKVCCEGLVRTWTMSSVATYEWKRTILDSPHLSRCHKCRTQNTKFLLLPSTVTLVWAKNRTPRPPAC